VRFVQFLWDFVVGDDWVAAAGAVAAIVVTAVTGFWWLLPLAVVLVLYVSLRRAT
jgi:divalent metal cation (Fe/Co/Zn/Cd) transporter